MKIIAGLGNPGLRYRNTRHNAGFMVVKTLAKRHRLPVRKKGFGGVYGTGRIKGRQVMLFEPLTLMNRSGEAVKSVCSAHLEEKEDLLVLSDDVNIPFGTIRIRGKGSAGGHNGLRSVIEHIGADFARLRIGIAPEEEVEDLAQYVLSPFPRKKRQQLAELIEKAADAVETWVEKDITETMNRHNSPS
ncbi:MAG: aminoacyl-tRNA hydrolase [Candidatus Omnitrophica bacterium]|nr:aminoacyl-tRNA hydrolase [Candidatus Omnitrophota bacterium]